MLVIAVTVFITLNVAKRLVNLFQAYVAVTTMNYSVTTLKQYERKVIMIVREVWTNVNFWEFIVRMKYLFVCDCVKHCALFFVIIL